MIINAHEMLNKAKENKYAVPQLNINNLEWTRYILEVCEEYRSPVILGVSEGAAKYMGGYKTVFNIIDGLVSDLNITIPVAIHLDHGKTVNACKQAIDAGFTSVMIDGSVYSLEKNIEITNEVVNYAHLNDVTVEAELGHIGGTEDDVTADIAYAVLEDCIELVNETKVDFLAPALGSVHGLYKGEPKIDLERMKIIRDNVGIPLVLHGGSGLPDEIVKDSILSGVCKININTELQIAWSQAVREYINNNQSVYDPRKIISAGQEALKAVVGQKITLFMSNNRI